MSLGLLGAYQSSDTDSDSGDETSSTVRDSDHRSASPAEPAVTLDNPFGAHSKTPLLPKPSFMQEQQDTTLAGVKFDSSVFSNPFRDKEDKKKAILEQHVNMTQRQEEMRIIDGKKVCWMYRKGRCRQGARCQFAHDNDVKTDRLREAKYDGDAQISVDKSAKGAVNNVKFNAAAIPREMSPPQEEEEAMKRKKRPGLSQTLVPSKRAMNFHKQVYGSN